MPAANRVILVDLGWNPSEDEQAIGRVGAHSYCVPFNGCSQVMVIQAYRYGQEKPVFVYRLEIADTVESSLRKNNDFKVALAK